MDQVSIAKSELRFQQWTKLVAECQSSQMTVKAWCELNNINIKTYYYWLHKIRAKALGNAPVPAVSQEPASIEPPVKFRKLEVLFFASANSQKLQAKMEKIASPFWRCNILHLALQFSVIKLCN